MKRALPWLILLAGCGGESEPVFGPTAGATYFEDVKPILDAKCTSCHDGGGIAPFTLTDYASASAMRGAIKLAVEQRTMPPWLAGPGCTDYLGDRSLRDDQIATITSWVDGDAPEGDPAREGAALDVGPSYALSRVDQTLSMPAAYTATISDSDDYRCFVIDWPGTAATHVTGFRANPGAIRSVHHVIAFLAGPDQAAAVTALDDGEAGLGYTCYGGPGAAASWIGVWTPGTLGVDFPADTGIRVDPGSKIVLQVHYSGLNGPPEPDTTSLDLKLDNVVAKQAWIQPWANLAWEGGGVMILPAGDPDVSVSVAYDPTLFVSNGQPIVMYSVGLHMHGLGTKGKVTIERAGGDDECLLDMPRWDPHWQGAYGLAEPRTLLPGDRIYEECHWDNSAENQPVVGGMRLPPEEVDWGESVRDEMCLGAFYLSTL